jgi:hypothetical protein
MDNMVNGLLLLNTAISGILLYLIIPISRMQGTLEMVHTVIASHDSRIQRLEDKV